MKTVFVSSTFRDMQFERDAIHNKITPILNEKAQRYGENISFCDLRWGVNTENLSEEDSSRKVLSVCLNEIERCRPYFVVILGDRYGFIPNAELVEDAVKKKNFKIDDGNCSITALEIEFGALNNSDQMKRTFFYFREIIGDDVPEIYKTEDLHHAEKLKKLKQKIEDSGGKIKNYTLIWNNSQKSFTGLENFENMLVEDISELISSEFEEYVKLSEYEKDQHIQWEFAKQKSAQFAGRQHLIKNYVEILNSGVNFLAIKGESGSGKSTLMSQLAFNLREEGYEVLPLFSSLTPKTNDVTNIVQYITEEIKNRILYTICDNETSVYLQNQLTIAEKMIQFLEKHKLLHKLCEKFYIILYRISKFCFNILKKIDILNETVDDIHNVLIQLKNFTDFYLYRNDKNRMYNNK